jgi:hypothetical protein
LPVPEISIWRAASRVSGFAIRAMARSADSRCQVSESFWISPKRAC